jgi:hypothetical protein
MILINLNKAKDIHREHLRIERKPLLDSLDVQFMRAVETGDITLQQNIAQKKQLLRDATASPDIDSAQTVDELKAVTLPTV